MTVVIPTLAADPAWRASLGSLERQSFRDFEVIVVDNSGRGAVRLEAPKCAARVLAAAGNLGFGAAVNWAARESRAEFIATLNDDAEAEPDWLAELHAAMARHPEAGMAAPLVLLADSGRTDSAGMLLCADGSSKQRGHGRPAGEFPDEEEAFFPSGSAALYRRALFSELGGYDESFFLYCEDSDLGLRARWAGFPCLYVPAARVRHRYSHTAGRASALKAYLVERNRLRVAMKNFPLRMLWRLPLAAAARYWAHLAGVRTGTGAAAEFARHSSPWRLAWFVAKAHLALIPSMPSLLAARARLRRRARLSPEGFAALAERFAIAPHEVAGQ